MKEPNLKLRSKLFARRCLKLASALPNKMPASYISNQLMRSSLSLAANYRAACISQSRKEFAAKISIVLEETDETSFWLEIIEDEKLISSAALTAIKSEADELTKIFAQSRITARKKKG
jgi:four helix bundle protein